MCNVMPDQIYHNDGRQLMQATLLKASHGDDLKSQVRWTILPIGLNELHLTELRGESKMHAKTLRRLLVHHGSSATHMQILHGTMRFTSTSYQSTSKVHATVLQILKGRWQASLSMQSKPDSQAAPAVQHQMQKVATVAVVLTQ